MMQNKKLVVGLAGGAGSGKSAIAAALSKFCNVYHINTDDIARQQMENGGISYKAVVEEFGRNILKADGEIDRTRLAEIVFKDAEKLEKLNSITHPNVTSEVKATIKRIKNESGEGIILLETAILFEVGYEALCDEVWYIYASEATRMQRLIKNRGYSEEKVRDIFSKQMKEKLLRLKSDRIIDNDSDDIKGAEKAVSKLFEKGNVLEYNA